jgi:hypothetical protein
MKERSFEDYYKLLKRDISKYLALKIDYFKLEFIESFSTIFSKIITLWISLLIGIIFISFLLIALALYLGHILGAYYWGFLIVAGIFMLIGIIFILLRNKILTNPLIIAFIETLFDTYEY